MVHLKPELARIKEKINFGMLSNSGKPFFVAKIKEIIVYIQNQTDLL
jgi:hypothetical protein